MKDIDMKNEKLLSTKLIWDERYEKGETTCTMPIAEGDPVDYTQYPFLYQHAVSKRLTGSPEIWIMEKIGSQFLRPPPGPNVGAWLRDGNQ